MRLRTAVHSEFTPRSRHHRKWGCGASVSPCRSPPRLTPFHTQRALHKASCSAANRDDDARTIGSECGPSRGARYGAIAAAVLVAGAFLVVVVSPANARIFTERAGQTGRRVGAPLGAELESRNTKSDRWSTPQLQQLSVREQVSQVMALTAEAKAATKAGDYTQALDKYSQIMAQFPELAITQYARLGHALLLYQTGSTSQAILELESLEAELRGLAEVHAALACIIYAERPAEVSYAEGQFDLASEFDSRYSNLQWTEREKGWPPAMLAALDRFLNLR